jgi:hypothetical protein
MTELGWSAVAADWHAQRLRRTVLRAWRAATTAAAEEQQQEAQHQQTWQRVRGWLAELEQQRMPQQSTPAVVAADASSDADCRSSWDAVLAALGGEVSGGWAGDDDSLDGGAANDGGGSADQDPTDQLREHSVWP